MFICIWVEFIVYWNSLEWWADVYYAPTAVPVWFIVVNLQYMIYIYAFCNSITVNKEYILQ